VGTGVGVGEALAEGVGVDSSADLSLSAVVPEQPARAIRRPAAERPTLVFSRPFKELPLPRV
jgi:hypothetical protein